MNVRINEEGRFEYVIKIAEGTFKIFESDDINELAARVKKYYEMDKVFFNHGDVMSFLADCFKDKETRDGYYESICLNSSFLVDSYNKLMNIAVLSLPKGDYEIFKARVDKYLSDE